MYVSAWVGYNMYLFSALISWHTVLKALSPFYSDRSSWFIFYYEILLAFSTWQACPCLLVAVRWTPRKLYSMDWSLERPSHNYKLGTFSFLFPSTSGAGEGWKTELIIDRICASKPQKYFWNTRWRKCSACWKMGCPKRVLCLLPYTMSYPSRPVILNFSNAATP